MFTNGQLEVDAVGSEAAQRHSTMVWNVNTSALTIYFSLPCSIDQFSSFPYPTSCCTPASYISATPKLSINYYRHLVPNFKR